MITSFCSCVRQFASLWVLTLGALLALDPARGQGLPDSVGGGAQIVLSALGLLGVPYRFGGSDPATGMDCSGLVQYSARIGLGLELPRQSEAMSRSGAEVRRGQLQPGDLVFFNTLGRAFSHVGIYLGNEQFVHAPSERGQVRIERLTQHYWRARYNGARRLQGTATGVAPSESVVIDIFAADAYGDSIKP